MIALRTTSRRVAVALLIGFATARRVAVAQGGGEKEADVRDRIEWMLRDRAYPFGELDRNPVFIARQSSVVRSAASSLR